LVANPDTEVPAAARPALQVLVSALERLEAEIRGLEAEIVRRARENEVARRLMTIPGVGPLIATALVALGSTPQTFRRGATSRPGWGSRRASTPRAASSASAPHQEWASARSGGCLIIGANSVVIKRHVHRRRSPALGWQDAARKPPMLVRVALANKMARIVLGLMRGRRSTGLRPWRRKPARSRGRRRREGQQKVWRNGRETGSGHPGCNRVPRARGVDLDPTANTIRARGRNGRIKGRTDVSTRQRTMPTQDPRCAQGVHRCCVTRAADLA
jgi:hypothetical protein